jgi:hypothetical protein
MTKQELLVLKRAQLIRRAKAMGIELPGENAPAAIKPNHIITPPDIKALNALARKVRR